MNDIYQTPKSNLEAQDKIPFKPHGFWKFYFWFSLVMMILTAPLLIYLPKGNLLDYINVLTGLVIVAALFGYVYSKQLINHSLWKKLSFIYPIWYIFYDFICPLVLKFTQFGQVVDIDWWLLLSPVFGIPCCIAMYLYAFKSDHIWNKST